MDFIKEDKEYNNIQKIADDIYLQELVNTEDINIQNFMKVIRKNLINLNTSSTEVIDSILEELNQTYKSQEASKDLFKIIYCETYFMLSAVGPIGDVIDDMSLSINSDDDKLEYN